MVQAGLRWRLEGGYSRFLEGSRVELRLEEGPLRQSLDISPFDLRDRSKPIEMTFRTARGFRGQGPEKLSWRVYPNGFIRSLILFPGNAFLGNFRVPQDHFTVQWDVDAAVEGSVRGSRAAVLMQVEGGTRLHHSWVEILPGELSIRRALRRAWKGYRNLLDPSDVFQMSDSQVVRWRWTGWARAGIDVKWGLGMGWVIPATVPLAKLQGELTSGPGLRARFQIEERGTFVLRVVRRRGKIDFSLRRTRHRTKRGGFSAGVSLGTSVRVGRLGFGKPKALRVASDALAGPLMKRANEAFRDALVRQMDVALAVEHARWKTHKRILRAVWSQPHRHEFTDTYAGLLSGSIPRSSRRLQVSGSFEQVRGKRFVISFNILNWIQFKRSTERQTR